MNSRPKKTWLEGLNPNAIYASTEAGIQELMRSFLMRTNFVPGVRHVIGWRGLKDSCAGVDGWTAKIKAFSGVFGLYFEGVERHGQWRSGRFGMTYFPDPEEELVENMSLAAISYAQSDAYLRHIRDFLFHPKLCELFTIGSINLSVDQSENALILGLESVTRQRTIALNGISLPMGGRMIELVAPGGYDQNFPSYDTALAFFRVVAASVTFNLQEPPVYLMKMHRRAHKIAFDRSGNHREEPSADATEEYLSLGFGHGDFKTPIKMLVSGTAPVHEDVVWENGDLLVAAYKNELWWNAHHISDFKTLNKQMLGIDDRPQLIVLTGFLGSGKTSFLQHFIEYQVQLNRFVAIVQNEIGEVGLDGKLLDHDYAVTEIDEGCVCCSLVGNLKKAIRQILSNFHPDYIVLETTGLANPYNLLEEIDEVADLVRFDSVTTMVDGLNMGRSLADYEIAKNQIKAADVLLLNKIDLLDEIQSKKTIKKLRKLNPRAPVILTAHGDINPALLYGVDPPSSGINASEQPRVGVDHNHDSHGMDHLSSHKIAFTRPLNRDCFMEAIKSVSPNIFRIKGVVDFVDGKFPMVFQYVGGRFELSEYKNLNTTDRFLVFIGRDIENQIPELDSFLGAQDLNNPNRLSA